MTDNVLEQAVKGWARTAPARTTELSSDKAGFGHFWHRAAELLARLPPKAKRDAGEAAAAAEILALARDSRTRFMRAHARGVYDSLTVARNRFVRVDALCERAATEYPGLVPGSRDLARESGIAQGEKDGLEVDQGIFLSQVLGDPLAGAHLCHAMLLPRAQSQELLPEFARTGKIELDGARLERVGKASILTMRNRCDSPSIALPTTTSIATYLSGVAGHNARRSRGTGAPRRRSLCIDGCFHDMRKTNPMNPRGCR